MNCCPGLRGEESWNWTQNWMCLHVRVLGSDGSVCSSPDSQRRLGSLKIFLKTTDVSFSLLPSHSFWQVWCWNERILKICAYIQKSRCGMGTILFPSEEPLDQNPSVSHCLICVCIPIMWGFPDGTSGKESTCQSRRHKRRSFDPWIRKIPWRREWMAIHSSILAWRIPWTKELGRLWSVGLQRVGHNWSNSVHTHAHTPIMLKCLMVKRVASLFTSLTKAKC